MGTRMDAGAKANARKLITAPTAKVVMPMTHVRLVQGFFCTSGRPIMPVD